MRKRVLILSHHYYPANRPPAHRIAKFAKYLPKFGWEPVVLCSDWRPHIKTVHADPGLLRNDTCQTIRVPFRINRPFSIPGLRDRLLQHLWPPLYPHQVQRAMRIYALEVSSNQRFDAIIASAPPQMTLAAASVVSPLLHIPWIADLRDLPTELHPKSLLRGWQMSLLERACASANALVTVSDHLASLLASRNQQPVFQVFNGFDPDDYPAIDHHPSAIFTIVYAGSIYEGRNPDILFDALDHILLDRQSDLSQLRVRFYTPQPRSPQLRVNHRPCAKLVEIVSKVPFHDIITIEQSASVLLFLSHIKTKGIMTSKIFEYLGARRPILSIPGDADCTDALLRETGAGLVARTRQEAARIILAWYQTWIRDQHLPYHPQPEKLARYTRFKQTACLADILSDAVSNLNYARNCRKSSTLDPS